MSVQLHYLEVFDSSLVMDQRIFDDQTKGFIDFEQRLDWNFGMFGHEGKRQTYVGQQHDK